LYANPGFVLKCFFFNQGGTLFCLRFNDELQFNNSEEYLWAIFDGTTRKKVVKYDEKEWLGKTPGKRMLQSVFYLMYTKYNQVQEP